MHTFFLRQNSTHFVKIAFLFFRPLFRRGPTCHLFSWTDLPSGDTWDCDWDSMAPSCTENTGRETGIHRMGGRRLLAPPDQAAASGPGRRTKLPWHSRTRRPPPPRSMSTSSSAAGGRGRQCHQWLLLCVLCISRLMGCRLLLLCCCAVVRWSMPVLLYLWLLPVLGCCFLCR
ncbi:hypothetical protein BRADI_1g34523v3 [Brachypodium distachyon]|uniref:Uncharacterized protein n=1 Tax=Brachypodium distachyon TaxID=15368 RepID=A0A2K2DMQ2_BRADI|nr:hypothetical protein BRADI_1g34523v3 [Brachypodium distachyon]